MAANPNTISAGIQETWDKVYQVTHHKVPVYPAVSSFRLAPGLKKGDTVHRQYRNTLNANDMGGDGSYQRQAIVDTDESLNISYEKETSFYIKELDELQNHLPVRKKHAFDSSAAIFNQIDGDVLGQYDQFTNSIDGGDFSGTDGNGVTLDTSNVRKLFSKSNKYLQRGNIAIHSLVGRFSGFRDEDMKQGRKVAVISPDVYETLLESLDGKETALGDNVGINGHQGRYFGYDIFVSNAVGWSAQLEMATNPTDGDTIVIGDATITFKATLSGGDGEVHIASTVDITRANLVEMINNKTADETEATDAGYAGFTASTDAHKSVLNVTATNDNTNDVMTLKGTGYGFQVLSETLTASADKWTAAKEIQHCLFGVAGAIEVVIQKTPNMRVKDRTGYVGVDVVVWAAYGIKVFNEGKPMMVDVRIRTDAYTT